MKVFIVFDNRANEGFRKGWGLSLFIRGKNKSILFDTGCSGEDLLYNLDKFGIKPTDFSDVVISHGHWDHTGGIFSLLNSDAYDFYVGESFSKKFAFEIEQRNGHVYRGGDWRKISDEFYITPELKENFPEQALVYNGDEFSFLFVGCSHPEVENFAELTYIKFKKPLYIMGGFHFYPLSEGKIEERVKKFESLHIKSIYPLHCTGEIGIKIVLRRVTGKSLQAGDILEF